MSNNQFGKKRGEVIMDYKVGVAVLFLFSSIIFSMQKNIRQGCLPWDLHNLTLKEHSRLLHFCSYNHNEVRFKQVLSCEKSENRQARHNALRVLISDIVDKDDIIENMKMYRQVKSDSFIVQAVQQGNYNACTIALLCGAKVHAQSPDKKHSLLSLALWSNKEDIVQLLLSQENMCVNALVGEANVPLCITSFTNNMTLFNCLLNHPAIDKNAQDHTKKSIVHYMAMSRHINELALLVEDERVNINLQDHVGNTPLHYAVMNGDGGESALIILLKRKDIGTQIKNFLNKTPYDLAHEYNYTKIAHLLGIHNKACM